MNSHHITVEGHEFQDGAVYIVACLPELQEGIDLMVRREGTKTAVVIPYPHGIWGRKYLELEAFLEKTVSADSRQAKDIPAYKSCPYRECLIWKDRVTFSSSEDPLPETDIIPIPENETKLSESDLRKLNRIFPPRLIPLSEDEDFYREAVALAKKHQVFPIGVFLRELFPPPGYTVAKVFIDRMVKEKIIHYNEALDRYVVTW